MKVQSKIIDEFINLVTTLNTDVLNFEKRKENMKTNIQEINIIVYFDSDELINIGHTKLKLKEFLNESIMKSSVQNRSRVHSSTQLISDYDNEDASKETIEILVALYKEKMVETQKLKIAAKKK